MTASACAVPNRLRRMMKGSLYICPIPTIFWSLMTRVHGLTWTCTTLPFCQHNFYCAGGCWHIKDILLERGKTNISNSPYVEENRNVFNYPSWTVEFQSNAQMGQLGEGKGTEQIGTVKGGRGSLSSDYLVITSLCPVTWLWGGWLAACKALLKESFKMAPFYFAFPLSCSHQHLIWVPRS